MAVGAVIAGLKMDYQNMTMILIMMAQSIQTAIRIEANFTGIKDKNSGLLALFFSGASQVQYFSALFTEDLFILPYGC